MSFYSKISLFALLAAGTALGMEQAPHLKAPAQSAAAQALNQPIIKIYSETQLIDTIQRNYLEASETLKNMLEAVDSKHALVLPESMIQDYLAIKDLFVYEYRFSTDKTDEKTVTAILKPKAEQQLVAIANACQRFELNNVGNCAIITLAEKLNAPARKEECLRDGSYHLNWTSDVAHLVAKEMYKYNQILFMTLTYLTELKQGGIRYWHVYQDRTGIEHEMSTCSNFYNRHILFRLTRWLSEHSKLIFDNKWCKQQGLTENPNILVNQVKDEKEQTTSTLYWEIDPEIVKIAKNLKPEQITILLEYYNKIHEMPLHLREILPQPIKQLLFPNWWQRRSWLSKAAIITGTAAITGLAAWYGYKHFSKK